MEEVGMRRWLKFPEDLVLAPEQIDRRLDPRHVWLIMRLIAQPAPDHVGPYRVRATWSQLRNSAARTDRGNRNKKARARSGYVSYDTVRKWAADLKRFGLLDWVPGGRGEDGDRPSVFDFSSFVLKTLAVRRDRLARRGKFAAEQ